MHFTKFALHALAIGVLAGKPRHKPKQHPEIPHKNPFKIPHKNPIKIPHKQPSQDKKPSAYNGPGQYYIENQATNTTMDLLYGEAGPDTAITA